MSRNVQPAKAESIRNNLNRPITSSKKKKKKFPVNTTPRKDGLMG